MAKNNFPLIVMVVGRRRFELVERFSRCGIDVPAGFVTDGASIPRPLWIFFAPHEYLKSAVIHDYGYAKAIVFYKLRQYAPAKEWFRKADTAFLQALKEDDRRVARLFYNVVRLYRKIRYWRAR
jgi:hypothetical protein